MSSSGHDTLIDLKNYYSFNHLEMLQFCLNYSKEELKSFSIRCKVNSLIEFLYLNAQYWPNADFNFSYGFHLSVPIKKFINKDEIKVVRCNLTDVLKKLCFTIPDVEENNRYNMLISYFANSTFPSIFGNFAFDELACAAFNFIALFINDDITIRLVGSFLKSSFFFQEQFTDHFFFFIKNKEVRTPSDLTNLLQKSFEHSYQYFSEYQIAAAKNIIHLKADKAPTAFFECFLNGIVSAWPLSQKFTNEIKNKIMSVFPKCKDILYALAELLKKFRQNHLEFIFKCFTIPGSTTFRQLPNYRDVIFKDGGDFAITKFDKFIINNIVDCCIDNKDPTPFSGDFIDDAFSICTTQYFSKPINFDGKLKNSEDQLERLRKSKETIEFLFKISPSFKSFQRTSDRLDHVYHVNVRKFVEKYKKKSLSKEFVQKKLKRFILEQSKVQLNISLFDQQNLENIFQRLPNKIDNESDAKNTLLWCFQQVKNYIEKQIFIDDTLIDCFLILLKEII